MSKAPKAESTRKPPEPTEDNGEIDEWMQGGMPDLQPVVKRLDEMIRQTVPKLQYALKWKKAYYGLLKPGWIIELVAYDVSVNIVFLGGEDFASPPPSGTGRSRYVKVRTLEDV